MSLILGVIGPEPLELFALELKKIAIFLFVYTVASTNLSTNQQKLGQNIYDHKILDEFDFGSDRTK